MQKIVEAVNALGNTSSSLEKLALLRRFATIPGFKDVMRFIYNPYSKTGIAEAKLKSALQSYPREACSTEVSFEEIRSYLSTHTTGSIQDVLMAAAFIHTCHNKYGHDAAILACAIVTQDLKIGVSVTSLNKVYGADFIPKTGCMLGTPFGDVGSDKVAWPCIITEKLDGIRRILIKEDGVCRLYSRSGHEDTGLVEIVKDAKYLPNNYVYDGELLAEGTFKDNIALRQATNSLASSKGTKTGLTFNVFDMVPLQAFYAGKCALDAKSRKILLGATLMDESIQLIDDKWWERIQAFGIHRNLEHIKSVPILGLAHNLSDVTPIVQSIWARGGEGVMLNTVSGPYEIKRSKQLLKVKFSAEYTLLVVGFCEGTGKYEDALGSLIVDYKGSKVGVGSGFTDDQRYEIWENQSKYLGRMVEVETFGESTNAQGFVSLNCPIFKRFVGEVE